MYNKQLGPASVFNYNMYRRHWYDYQYNLKPKGNNKLKQTWKNNQILIGFIWKEKKLRIIKNGLLCIQ